MNTFGWNPPRVLACIVVWGTCIPETQWSLLHCWEMQHDTVMLLSCLAVCLSACFFHDHEPRLGQRHFRVDRVTACFPIFHLICVLVCFLSFSSLKYNGDVEMLRTWLDMVLGSLLWLTLLEQGVGPDDLQGCLPTSAALWFCNSHIRNYWWAGSFNSSNPNQGMSLPSFKALHFLQCLQAILSRLWKTARVGGAETLRIVFPVKWGWRSARQQTALVVHFSFSSCTVSMLYIRVINVSLHTKNRWKWLLDM